MNLHDTLGHLAREEHDLEARLKVVRDLRQFLAAELRRREKAPPKACPVDGCGSLAVAKGMCKKHYNREYQRQHPWRRKMSESPTAPVSKGQPELPPLPVPPAPAPSRRRRQSHRRPRCMRSSCGSPSSRS